MNRAWLGSGGAFGTVEMLYLEADIKQGEIPKEPVERIRICTEREEKRGMQSNVGNKVDRIRGG